MALTLSDNQFFTGLVNLALFMKLYATNTSAEPDKFVNSFATETLAYGDTKLFPFSNLPSVTDYSESTSLLNVTKVDVNEEKLSVSVKKVIKSSYPQYILEMAFTDASGMNNFVGYILGQMYSAKTDYLYDMIRDDLYAKTYKTTNKQTHEVALINTSGISDTVELNNAETINQKRIALAIQNDIDNITVFNTQYNDKGYKQALDVKDLRLVINAGYDNEQVVNLFASLLRSDYVEKSFHKPEKLKIPTIKVPSGSEIVIGWIMHRYHYQFFYKFVHMGSFFDTSNLSVNSFLHFWIGKGHIDNLPAVKLIASYA